MTPHIEGLTRQYWNRAWARFLRHQGMIAPSVKLIQQMIPYLHRHARVLDLGCGEGRNTIYLSRIGYQAVGLDLSSEAVQVLANNLFEEEILAGAVIGDARKLPFKSGIFDGLVAHHLFDHLDGSGFDEAFAEAGRVLRSGGIMLLTIGNFSHLREDKRVVQRDDGSFIFTEGPNKGMLVRSYESARLDNLDRQGWTVLKDELTPRGSKIMLLRRNISPAALDV